jgi:cell division protein FtsI/penicillin-binding protein 2
VAAEYQKTKPSRLAFLAICFAVMAIVLFTRLIYWQVLRRDDVRQNGGTGADNMGSAAWRGSIYDSHGHFLAVPSVVYDVGASPKTITEPERVAAELSPLVNVPVPTLVPELKQTTLSYVPLARNISAIKGQAIKDLGQPGIKLDVNPGRYYPEGNLAAAVLGFVNSEQHAFYGIEEYYDSRLRASAGSGADGEPQTLLSFNTGEQPQSGVDLVLTIDRVIQHSAEEYLDKALKDYGAKGGEIIVMDPKTGAVLAMAVAPGYDPNNYTQVTSQEVWTNGAISKGYEPGSVFKIVTMAAGLDAGTTTPDDTYDDTGRITVGGKPIENWDKKAHGITTCAKCWPTR